MSNILVKDLRRLSKWFVRAYFNASDLFSEAFRRSQAGIAGGIADARRDAGMPAKPVRKTRKKTAAKKKN